MRILIVDDEIVTRFLLTSRLDGWGHQVSSADNGREAWRLLQQEHFDVVISDWNMPEINGLELCRLVRSNSPDPYRYIILCTANDRKGDLITGMDAGADDFIVKPVDAGELRARLHAAERVLELQAGLAGQNASLRKLNEKLSSAYQTIERDLQAAAAMQLRLLPKKPYATDKARLDWMVIPSRFLAGDMLNYFMVDEHLIFYQLDVSGHGIPAALLSVTLNRLLMPEANSPIFSTNSTHQSTGARILAPVQVVSELNRRFQGMDDQYFTIVYGVLNTATGELQFCQAGHPTPIYQGSTEELVPVGNGGFPVGMWPEMEYEQTNMTLAPGDRLFLYSDGVTECRNPAGEMYSIDRLGDILRKTRRESLPGIIAAVQEDITTWRCASEFSDDVSLLVLERFQSDPPQI